MPSPAPLPFLTVFTGDDTISREKEKHDLLTRIVAQAGTIDEHLYDSDTDSPAGFCERILTPSLFPTVRVFYIRHANQFGADASVSLDSLLRGDIPEVHVIVESDESAGTRGGRRKTGAFDGWVKKVGAAAKKHPGLFVVRALSKPADYKIAQWLVENVPALFNRRINKRDADYFVDLVGFDFDTINSELQKVDIFLPAGTAITRAVIAEAIEGSRTMSAFELAQALGKKDLPRVTEIVDSLFTASFYAPPVVAATFRHFWALFRIRCYARKNPQNVKQFLSAVRTFDKGVQNTLGLDIGIAAGLLTAEQGRRIYPVIIKSGIIDQALSFSMDAYRTVFRLLQRYDFGIKTGKVDGSKRSFELLCYRIARSSELDTLASEL